MIVIVMLIWVGWGYGLVCCCSGGCSGLVLSLILLKFWFVWWFVRCLRSWGCYLLGWLIRIIWY